MYYKFNETNNMTGYIKEMLKDFNLPIYRVYRKDRPLYEGRFYIKDHSVCKCVNGKLEEINIYLYNQKQINMTTKLIINSSVYDSYTHNYLGNYLRFIRDYKGIDLMPLYNCFSNESPAELYTSSRITDNYIMDINTGDDKYKYYIVPVKFNEEYTIAIDSPVPYEMACFIYTGSDINDMSYELMSKTHLSVGGSSFTKPFTYSTDIDASNYWEFEKNLRLLIKLPAVVNSSITILEGNYTKSSATCQNISVGKIVINEENKNSEILPRKLSLLKVNDKVSYPFADRLVEYLIKHAITSDEKIQYNIGRLQSAVYKGKRFRGDYDIWDKNIRFALYNKLDAETGKNANITINSVTNDSQSIIKNGTKLKFSDMYYDLLSYGDKDVSTFLGVARWQ